MMSEIILYIKKHYKAIFVLLFLAGAFYWFQVRPAIVRAACESDTNALDVQQKALGDPKTMTQLNFHYSACLHEHGI